MKLFPKKKFYLSSLALVITLLLCVAVVFYWEYIQRLQNYGYLGVFIISFFAGSILILPVPYVAVVFTLGGVLNPALVGATSALGMTLGGVTIYLTGYTGHKLLPNIDVNDNIYSRIANWARRRGAITVFVMSAVFNPFFIPMAIIMGMLRFHLWKFFLLTWAGNTIKNLIIAYAGYLGLRSLLRFLGVGL